MTEWQKCLLWTLRGEKLEDDYLEDIQRVQLSLNRVRKTAITELEATIFWQWVSEDYCAGWLMLPEDDEELDRRVKKYVDKLMEDDDE